MGGGGGVFQFQKRMRQLIIWQYLAENCMKIKEIGSGVHMALRPPPLDLSMVFPSPHNFQSENVAHHIQFLGS